jgi:hypothetical protein
MPTVPTSFVPQVAPQGGGDIGQFQAPQVAVAQNLAAEQQVRFGQATTAAGNQVFRLGSAIQDGIDEAKTKAQDIWAQTQIGELLNGPKGYLRTVGQDADANYAAASDQLSQISQQAMDGLDNDTQRTMLRNVIARNMMNYQAKMLDHRDNQVKVWLSNESRARADIYASRAVEDFENRGELLSNYSINRGVALNELKQAAALSGIKEGSAQFTALEQQLDTQLTQGIVNRLMLANRYDEAYDWVSAQQKAGKLERKAGDSLMASIDANRDRFIIDEYATTIKGYGRVGRSGDEANNPEDAPGSLRDALEIADGIKDPEIRKGVQAALRTQYGQEEALQRQEYNFLIDRVEQFLAVPGNDVNKIPPTAWGRLKSTDQARFLKAQREEDELGVMEELARNPAVLTRKFLEDNRGRMTRQTYTKLLGDLNAPDKVIAATLDADQVEATFLANGLTKLTNPKTDTEKNESLTLRNMFKQQIDDMQSAMKRPLNRTEKQKVLDQVIMQYSEKVYEPDWVFDNEMRLGAMTPEQRQTAYVMVGKNRVTLSSMPQSWISGMALPEFRRAGIQNPTMTQIADLWLRKGKPSQ